MKYSRYYIIHLGCFMGFTMHFYITFGTNLLTQSPVPVSVFPLFPCFAEKEYQTESKRNETFGKVIFGKKAIRETWSARQGINEESTRQGARPPPGRALHPHGPLVAPLTDFFRLYIPIYPKTFGEQNRSGVSPPQACVATKNQSGPCSGTLPEGGSLTGGHLHHPGALHDEEGVVHPRG